MGRSSKQKHVKSIVRKFIAGQQQQPSIVVADKQPTLLELLDCAEELWTKLGPELINICDELDLGYDKSSFEFNEVWKIYERECALYDVAKETHEDLCAIADVLETPLFNGDLNVLSDLTDSIKNRPDNKAFTLVGSAIKAAKLARQILNDYKKVIGIQ